MEDSFVCFLCKSELKNIDDLKDHLISHNSSRLGCHFCEISFLKFESLKYHLIKVHSDVNNIIINENTVTMKLGLLKKQAEILQSNGIREYINNNKVIEDKTSSRNMIEKVKEPVNKENINLCGVCGKSYKTLRNLTVHSRIHDNIKPFKCNFLECNKSFYTSSHLKDHSKIHLNQADYKCDKTDCGRTFIHMSSFKKHQKMHLGIKNHACPICSRTFSQSHHLKDHLKIHTDEREFMCKMCPKTFRRSDTLKVHLKVHKSV
ncbi:unnamed protein product [Diamesa serratosioi]